MNSKYLFVQDNCLSFLKREHLFVILCLVSSLLFFFELGGRSFEIRDVPRYAEMAREMLHTGGWMVTRYQGHVYMSKPPMLMWLIALFSSWGDQVTPLTARLPGALAGIAGILMTFYFAQTFFNRHIAFFSSIILATCQKYFWHGREIRTDMPFSVFVALALYFFYMGYRQKKGFFYAGFYLFMVFATLTKGPLGIIFVLSIVVAYLALQRDLKALKTMKWHWGAIIFISIIGVWGGIFCLKVGVKPLMATVKTELLTRVNNPISHAEPFYYYFVKVWADFAPWSLFIPFACVYGYKKLRGGNAHITFIFCWIVVIFVLLCSARAKGSRYMIPMFPAISILVANLISDTLENVILRPRWLTPATKWIILATATLASITLVATPPYFLNIWAGIAISIAIILILIKLFVYFNKRKRLLPAGIAFVIFVTALGWMLFVHQLTRQSRHESFGPKLVFTIQNETQGWDGCTITGYQLGRDVWNVINLNLNRFIPRITDLGELRKFLSSSGTKPVCIIEREVFGQIEEDIMTDSLEIINVPARKHPLIVLTRKGN